MDKILCVDCDSTLSTIEGIDELAAACGPTVEEAVVNLTNQAMDGEVPLDEVFGRRIELIQPTRELSERVGQMYIETLLPGVSEVLGRLSNDGWTIIIISGGFKQLIEPLAAKLNISDVYAVPIHFNEDGSYRYFDESFPTTRNGGKPEIILQLKEKWQPKALVMLGDGVSDLETKPHVDLFIGFGGVVNRAKVKEGSDVFISKYSELEHILSKHFPR